MSKQPVINTRSDLVTAIDYIYRLQAEIDRLKSERRWIPVSERLPELCEPVLTIYNTNGGISAVSIRVRVAEDKWANSDNDKINFTCNVLTHWMLLPTPPEDE